MQKQRSLLHPLHRILVTVRAPWILRNSKISQPTIPNRTEIPTSPDACYQIGIRIQIENPKKKNWMGRGNYGTRPAFSWRRRNSVRSLSSWICLRSSSSFFCSASCFCSAFHTFSMFLKLPVCHPFLFRNFSAIFSLSSILSWSALFSFFLSFPKHT